MEGDETNTMTYIYNKEINNREGLLQQNKARKARVILILDGKK